MKKFYTVLGYIAGVGAIFSTPFAWWSLIPFAVFVYAFVVILFLGRKEDRHAFDALFLDIFAQNHQLYESEKGNITYEIDKHAITIRVQEKSYFEAILSLAYDKKTGNIAVTKQNDFITDEQVEQFKRWLLRKEKKQTTVQKTVHTKDAFLLRLEKMDFFRKELLQQEHLDIETVHLLEQTLPHDLNRLKNLYQTTQDEEKEHRFIQMLEVFEETLNRIQKELDTEHEQAFEQLEHLLLNRYSLLFE